MDLDLSQTLFLAATLAGLGLLGRQDSPARPLSSRRGLPTDRYMWSDASGLQECTKAGTKPPSLQWSWVSTETGEQGRGQEDGAGAEGQGWEPALTGSSQVSDWFVDFSVPGGTDQEGWQYASDFPA